MNATGAGDRLDRVIRLAGGRRLGFADLGDPQGIPVIFFHGTPGSRLDAGPLASAAETAKVRLLAPDRPGYGLSDPSEAMSVAGWAADVAEMADQLGLGQFAVAGISGGGPYALACAARLAGRVSAAAAIAPAVPVGMRGDRAEMHAANRLADAVAAKVPNLEPALHRALAFVVRRYPGIYLRLGMRFLPPADRRAMADPEMRRTFQNSAAEQFRQGPSGTLGDRRIDRDWGFEPREIRVPVYHWHGNEDRNVPLREGRRLAEAIPTARLEVVAGEGHLLIPAHWPAILDDLLRPTETSDSAADAN